MGGSYALKRRAVCSMWSEYTLVPELLDVAIYNKRLWISQGAYTSN